MLIAPDGHSSTQVSQSTHSDALIFALSSSISIASAGQISTQVVQPVHALASTFAGIFHTCLYIISFTLT